MSEQVYLAIDLGAESGRVMAGSWDGARMQIEELHRFTNGPVEIAGTLRWDVLRLWEEIQRGLRIAGTRFGKAVVSVAVDAWGLDYVLLSKSGELLGLPFHYRDPRTRGALDAAFLRMPREEIFRTTGIQFMEINSLYQLLALQRSSPEILDAADCFLTIPDFFHWCLCGEQVCEFTNATTTQLVSPQSRTWAADLIARFGLPSDMFPQITPPGARLGALRSAVAAAAGLPEIDVITPAAHDTGSAVAAVPARGDAGSWAYISSGTWSLLGGELAAPVLTDLALQHNFTNEGGVDGTWRLLKNIMGLWLVQQCRRSFEVQGRTCQYSELVQLAKDAPPCESRIDPDDPRFLNPPDMAAEIQAACRECSQPVPESDGAIVRCALESLAAKYAIVLSRLEELTGQRAETLHIVGGGARNDFLNQLTATACRRKVIAGPVEATALGNLLVQAKARGEFGSLAELRRVAGEVEDVRVFH